MKTPASKEEMEAPKRIWIDRDRDSPDSPFSWYWTTEPTERNGTDVEYVRAEAYDALVAALNGLGWHSQNLVDICWCDVKSSGFDYNHTQPCKDARAALALATPKEKQQ